MPLSIEKYRVVITFLFLFKKHEYTNIIFFGAFSFDDFVMAGSRNSSRKFEKNVERVLKKKGLLFNAVQRSENSITALCTGKFGPNPRTKVFLDEMKKLGGDF